MIEIEKPRIDCENLAEDGSYGKFVVEPLERGTEPPSETLFAAFCCRACRARRKQHQDQWCAARVLYHSV